VFGALAHRVQQHPRLSNEALVAAAYGGRTGVIAQIIERYVAKHPRAADTAEGVRAWWVGAERHDASIEDVQQALDVLVESGRLCRSILPDGAAIYSRPPHNDSDTQ
jgi:hypothetical protein